MLNLHSLFDLSVFKRHSAFIYSILISFVVGILSGLIGGVFAHLVNWASSMHQSYPWLIYLLPLGGIVIALIYQIARHTDGGTDLVLSSIHSDIHLPVKIGPLIFISTVITHLFGGSAGREGAALQLGGSIGSALGKFFHLDEEHKKTLILAGMSGCFSALFGTPLTAAIFPLEVGRVGQMQYAGILPCVISAILGHLIATSMHLSEAVYVIGSIPEMDFRTIGLVAILAILAGLVSSVFVISLKSTHHFFERMENPYIRTIIGGVCIIALTLLVGNQDYNGAGSRMISLAFVGQVPIYAFLMKMIFTSITLGSGYKGGEIIPALFIGATLGSVFGTFVQLPIGLCAAVGMVAMFCGVTNCPIASVLIGIELFDFQAAIFLMIAVAVSYVVSGYFGLYKTQQIVFSKYAHNQIDRNTK